MVDEQSTLDSVQVAVVDPVENTPEGFWASIYDVSCCALPTTSLSAEATITYLLHTPSGFARCCSGR